MPIETRTYNSWPLGSNLAVQPHEIPDGYARYLQDILLDRPGEARKRGPQTSKQALANVHALIGCYNPSGTYAVAAIKWNGATGEDYYFLNSDFTSYGDTQGTGFSNIGSYEKMIDAKAALGGGVVVGSASAERNRNESTYDGSTLWKGSTKDGIWYDGASGKSVTATRNSKTVTGVGTSFATQVEPGMFLAIGAAADIANEQGYYIGCVKSVESNTSLTLEKYSPVTVTNDGLFMPWRNMWAHVSRGRITCSTSATTVNGADTAFVDDGITSSPAYQLHRASDWTYIGTVTSIQSNTQLTLTANAAIAMNNEDYYAIPVYSTQYVFVPGSTSTSIVNFGWLNATWQGRQWYGNRPGFSTTGVPLVSRLYFSEPGNLEAVNMGEQGGSFFDIPSTSGTSVPIRALLGTESALMIFKEDETYAMTGSSPDTWRLDRVLADGPLSNQCVVPYGAGCVFAGKAGIYVYDGSSIRNITQENLGDYWVSAVKALTATKKVTAFIDREHYFVHIDGATVPTGYGVMKNGSETGTGSTNLTICVNLKTNAVTFMTGMKIRAAHKVPAASGGYTLYATDSNLVASNTLFDDTTSEDNITGSSGPSLYVETGKYDMGDELRKKLFKVFMLHHWNEGGTLTLETVKGLGNDYTVSTTTFSQNSAYAAQRIKFLKRGQYVQFRIYETSSAVTRAKLGAYAIGFKWQRPGRV